MIIRIEIDWDTDACSLEELRAIVKEVEREVEMRGRVYVRQVDRRNLTREGAERKIAKMRKAGRILARFYGKLRDAVDPSLFPESEIPRTPAPVPGDYDQ